MYVFSNFAKNFNMRYLIFLLTTLLLLTMGCNNDNNSITSSEVNNPNTATGNGDMSTLPKFQFVTEEHDFGKLGQGEKVSYTFKFKNVGKSNLIISDAKATCGCTVADYPHKPISPGAEDGIMITFNTEGKKGIQHKTVTLVANTQPNTKVLTIKAEIRELLNN
jgi:hypothetical protein